MPKPTKPAAKKVSAKKAAPRTAARKPPAKPPAKKVAAAKPTPRGPRKLLPAELPAEEGLSDLHQLFVREYLVDQNATQAYLRLKPDAKPATAANEAYRLMRKPEIAGAIAAGLAALRNRATVTAEEVVSRLCAMASADERELMEVRVGCCRYCWGKNNRYQFTRHELLRAEAEHARLVERDEVKGDFDQLGGDGFNANRPPNPDCEECFGDGAMRPVFKDTRNLSPGAAMLFAGVKQTKDGFEIKTHSRADAMVNLGRHFGLFNDKLNARVEVDAVGELREFLANRQSRLPIQSED